MIKKKAHICSSDVEQIDAEEFYKSKIEELMFKIRTEEEHQSSQNLGMGFITLKDGELA